MQFMLCGRAFGFEDRNGTILSYRPCGRVTEQAIQNVGPEQFLGSLTVQEQQALAYKIMGMAQLAEPEEEESNDSDR